MALSSQGGLDFRQSRLQDSTENARNALSEFGSLAQRFQDNKLKAEALAEAKAQQAIENARADRAEAMQKEQFEMRKKEFDTMQNTLRATSEAVPEMDKRATGQALLNDQVAKLIDPLNARTTALAAKSGMTKEQFEQSDLMTKAVQAGAFADLTGVGAKEATAGGSIGASAQAMLSANQKDMNVQKRLLSEFTPSFLKPDSDEAMLYDSSKINDYRQNLLQGLDRRIHEKDVLDQNAAQFDKDYKLKVANAKREEEHMRKVEKAAEEEKNRSASVAKALFEANMPKLVKTPGKYIDDPKPQQKLVEYDKRTASAQKDVLAAFYKAYPDISISEKQIKDDKTGKVLSVEYSFKPLRQGLGYLLQTPPAAVQDQFERTVRAVQEFRADPKNKGKTFRIMLAHGPGATFESNRQAIIDSILKPSISTRDTILKEIEASKFGGAPKVFVPGTQSYVYPKNQAEVINRYGEAIQAKLAKGIPVSNSEYEAYVILKNKLNDFSQMQALYDQKIQDENDQAQMNWKLAHPDEE